MNIQFANTHEELVLCFPVVSQLRPHLTLENYLALVSRMQQNHGYQLAYLDDGGVKAVAGIRVAEWLPLGKYLEIEDLITSEDDRSKGYGGLLFDWVKNYAKEMQCNQLRLVSGIQRERAHSFYIGKGMTTEAKYFSLML